MVCPEKINDCWCWCSESTATPTCTPISSIINWWGLEMETTTSWDWCQVVTITNPTDVVSSDWTLDIVRWYYDGNGDFVEDEDGMVFDIKKPCCEDRLVATSAWDAQPWHLMSKLHSCDDSVLSITEQNIAWVNKAVFCINTSSIIWPDEKVRYDAWCTPWFVKPMLVQWYGMSLSDVWCSKRFSVDRNLFRKPMFKQYATQYVQCQYPTGNVALLPNNWWFWITTDTTTDNMFWLYQPNYFLNFWWGIWTNWWWEYNVWTCTRTWYYRVRFSCSWLINWWVDSFRVALVSDVSWYQILIWEWVTSEDDTWRAYNQTVEDGNNQRWRWWEFNKEDIVPINAWDKIFWLFGRLDNSVTRWAWAWQDGIAFLWTWPAGFNPDDIGNAPPWDPKFTGLMRWVERVSDLNWYTIY